MKHAHPDFLPRGAPMATLCSFLEGMPQEVGSSHYASTGNPRRARGREPGVPAATARKTETRNTLGENYL